MPHHCVFGCKYNLDVPVHVFPDPKKYPDHFKIWVNLVDKGQQRDLNYYRTKRVCDLHFIKEHKNRNRRLNALAVPTLFLSGPDVVLHKFPDPVEHQERFSAWKYAVGGYIFSVKDDEIAKTFKICRNHFEEKYHTWTNRLASNAVPTLNLRGQLKFNLLDNAEPDVRKHSDHTYSKDEELNTNSESFTLNASDLHPHTLDQKLQHVDQQSQNMDQDTSLAVEDLSDGGGESPCPSPEIDEEPEKEATDSPVTCHECHTFVEGYRFQCVSCSGCVVCGSCVSLGVHPTCYVLRVPPQRPLWEVQAVLRAVRGALAMSAFADRLAEPLADYSIAQADIKSETEDDPDHDMDESDLNRVQDEDEVMETVIADPLQSVVPDPLATTTPSKKTSQALRIKTRSRGDGDSSFRTQTTDDICDVESETGSHTDAISHPNYEDSDSGKEYVVESDDDVSYAAESEASASRINTDVAEKRFLRLRDRQSTQGDKDKFSEPITSPQKTFPALRIKPRSRGDGDSFRTQATDDMSNICDVESETESHTDATYLDYEDSGSDKDYVVESDDDVSGAVESEAGASMVNNADVPDKRVLRLRDGQSTKCDKDKFSKPITSQLYVKTRHSLRRRVQPY